MTMTPIIERNELERHRVRRTLLQVRQLLEKAAALARSRGQR